MRLSQVLRVMILGKDGQAVWKEITENKLPKGGKKLSFRQNAVIGFGIVMFVFSYAHFQDEINPGSKWSQYFRTITREPFAWLTKDQQNLPISPDHMPPIK
ncbi:unnamed protein product [Caenorhabditis angaria]|uniref:Uncharacterized protein n=1 Tax=Caenorhabditis angaria TaxID=860376 RepID=A0A9P1IBN2_9PELO|nr:unnamed protein product [Caenorhabditis angaria]